MQVAEDMADADHAKEVVKLQDLLSLQVLLERRVDDVSGFAVRPKELALKLHLSDLLVKGIPETAIQSTELLVLSLAFHVQLFVLHFRSMDIEGIRSFCLSKLGSSKIVTPFMSWVFLAIFLG